MPQNLLEIVHFKCLEEWVGAVRVEVHGEASEYSRHSPLHLDKDADLEGVARLLLPLDVVLLHKALDILHDGRRLALHDQGRDPRHAVRLSV